MIKIIIIVAAAGSASTAVVAQLSTHTHANLISFPLFSNNDYTIYTRLGLVYIYIYIYWVFVLWKLYREREEKRVRYEGEQGAFD